VVLAAEPLAPVAFVCCLVLAVFAPPVFCEEAAGAAVSCAFADPENMPTHSSAAAQLAVKIPLRVLAQPVCSNVQGPLKPAIDSPRKNKTQLKLAL